MTCKEFEKKIPDFIGRKLDYPTLKQFHEHMDGCEKCREEVSISFLVMDGLSHLEDGDSFDLQRELDFRMEESKKRLLRNDRIMKAGFCLEVAAAVVMAGLVVWLLV